MHYRNGRVSENGDKVVCVQSYTNTVILGTLTNATAGSDYCNGYLFPSGPCVNLRECLHFDDFLALWSADRLAPKG